jgi:hypothetical protein
MRRSVSPGRGISYHTSPHEPARTRPVFGPSRVSDGAMLVKLPIDILSKHHVLVHGDNVFQSRARLLQALWREDRGFPIGEREQRPGVPLGSMLLTTFATASGANLLTEGARASARREVAAKHAGSGQHIVEERLWCNLLSSQPLAFNLFAELELDLELATRVFRRLWPDRIARVTRIAFEYSPGRGSATYTSDKTAFDVYVEHATPGGGRGFVGIAVKYHEALDDHPAKHRSRYDEVTGAMGCFKPVRRSDLDRAPVEQIWRDHLLAGSMLLDAAARWEMGLCVFVHPGDNAQCSAAVQLYRSHLSDTRTFDTVTLETVVCAIEGETDAAWIRDLRDRYLGWGRIQRVLTAR